jgi:ParB-like chromosome segregation protein Spo0J
MERKGQMRAGKSTREFKLAVIKAEKTLKRPKGPNETVLLMPSEIKTRPELFQVREFSFGMKETDPDHVKILTHNIGIHGELDPITVVKLGTKFVIVEGHHRLAAYKSAQWMQPIKCMWFPGSVHEAIDESMRANAKDRLNVPFADKAEHAWKRTLLGWGSKAEVAKLCGVSESTVAHMRRLVRLAKEDSDEGAEFRKSVGGRDGLMDTSWYQAKLAALGLAPEEIDEQEQAERLARRMRARLDDLLSRSPKVTAQALRLYDPELPEELSKAWQVGTGQTEAAEDENGQDSPRRGPEALEDEREPANGRGAVGERHAQEHPWGVGGVQEG